MGKGPAEIKIDEWVKTTKICMRKEFFVKSPFFGL
jgi:hypothetical protein